MRKVLCAVLTVSVLLTGCGTELADNNEIGSTKETVWSDAASSAVSEDVSLERVTIAEKVLWDDSGVKITAKSIDFEGWRGPELKLLIENNTDIDLIVQNRYTSVNGYMVDANMSANVSAGKKANDHLTLYAESLELHGIETIADIATSFYIYSHVDDTKYSTAPVTVETSEAGSYQYNFDDSGDILYEGEGVRIVNKGIGTEDDDSGVYVYVENDTQEFICVQARDLSVNGFMTGCIFSLKVAPGKRAIDFIKLAEDDLAENEISEIDSVELSFHIYSNENRSFKIDTSKVVITKE